MSNNKKHQCPSCGGILIIDNDKQMYRCASCGSAYDFEYFREDRLHGMGETYLSRGELNAAVDAYRRILKNAPHDFLALRGLMLAAARLKDMDDLIPLGEAKHFAYDSQMVREVLDAASEEDTGYFEDLARIYYHLKELSDRNAEIKLLNRNSIQLENTIRLEEQDTYNYKISGRNYTGKDPVAVFFALWLAALVLFIVMLCLVVPLAVSGEGFIATLVGLVFAFFIGLAVVVNMKEIYPEIKDEKDTIAYVRDLRNESETIDSKIKKLKTETAELSAGIKTSIRDFVENDRLIMTGSAKEQVSVPKTGKIKKHQCPSCGGSLRIDSDKQMYHCTFCGSTYDYEYFREDQIHEAGETYLSKGEFMATTDAYGFMLKKDPHDFLALRGLMLTAARLTNMNDLEREAGSLQFSYDAKMVSEAIESALEEDKEYFKEFAGIYSEKKRLNDCTEEFESVWKEKSKIDSIVAQNNSRRVNYYVRTKGGVMVPPKPSFILFSILTAVWALFESFFVTAFFKTSDLEHGPEIFGSLAFFGGLLLTYFAVYAFVICLPKIIKLKKIDQANAELYAEHGWMNKKVKDLEDESARLLGDIRRSIHDFVKKDRRIMRDREKQ